MRWCLRGFRGLRSFALPMLGFSRFSWVPTCSPISRARKLRLCARVSSCEFVEWTASLGTHHDSEPLAAVDWTTQGVVAPGKCVGPDHRHACYDGGQ